MEVLIVLFVVWVAVVLIGHGSWVVLRLVFRSLSAPSDSPTTILQEPEKQDLRAAYRVLNRMTDRGLLNPMEVKEFRTKLANLEFPTPTSVPAVDTPMSVEQVERSAQPAEEMPVIAILIDDAPSTEVPTCAAPAVPEPPALSKAEVIRSFLAAHNIRWGELVAGILIVVCSIGLVVNLWSELVQTHRVIPSLIFLCGNAAIFSAGLYTLSRWRLRHTSRAVLVIATLLVPLSVLAGLAAAGPIDDAVRLNDPITLAALALGGCAYVFFLLRGGRALVGKSHATSLALGVAGPAMVLPFLPSCIRLFSSHAGWVVGFGGFTLAASLLYTILHRHRSTRLGIAATRNRILQIGVGTFALAVLVAYSVFALRAYDFQSMLPIAIACIPALITIAGVGRAIMTSARHPTHSMVGCVIAVIAIGLACAVLPSGMSQSYWVWAWATTMTVCGMVIGWLLRQPRWLAVSTFPVGLAAMFSSPVWLGDATWQSTLFWQRLIGGEPMIAAGITAIVTSVIAWIDPDTTRRRWTSYASLLWCGAALVIATILAVSPPSWLGTPPWWFVSVILSLGTLVAVMLAQHQKLWSGVATFLVTVTVSSITRPLTLTMPPDLATSKAWMVTALAISLTLLVIREAIPFIPLREVASRRQQRRSAFHFSQASVVSACIAAAIGCVFAMLDWQTSAWVVGVSAILLLWAASTVRSPLVIQISQLASIAFAAIVGYGNLHSSLYPFTAWTSNLAPWTWALVFSSVTAAWLVVRAASSRNNKGIARRIGFLSGPRCRAGRMVDGAAAKVGVAAISIGAILGFIAILTEASGVTWITDQSSIPTSLLALAAVTVVLLLLRKFSSAIDRRWILLGVNTVAISAVVWIATQLASWATPDAIAKLITATTVATIGCGLLCVTALRRFDPDLGHSLAKSSSGVAMSMIALASIVLLVFGWFDPMSRQQNAAMLPTMSVATWWSIGSAIALYLGKRLRNRTLANVSALLLPVAAALVVPVYWQSSPVVWLQVAALTSLVWVLVSRLWVSNEKDSPITGVANSGSVRFAFSMGMLTAVLVIVSAITSWTSLYIWFGPVGAILSTIVVAMWCLCRVSIADGQFSFAQRLPYPIGGSLLAGQAAWLICSSGMLATSHFVEIMLVVWTAMATWSVATYWRTRSRAEFWHTTCTTVLVSGLVIYMGSSGATWLPWAGVTVCAVGGMLVALASRDASSTNLLCITSRLLGWWVIAVGGYLFSAQVVEGVLAAVTWTAIVGWFAFWIMSWRLLSPDRSSGDAPSNSLFVPFIRRAAPDFEVAVLLAFGLIAELILSVLFGHEFDRIPIAGDPLLMMRATAILVVVCTTGLRSRVQAAWQVSIGSLVALFSLVAVRFAFQLDADWNQRLAVANLSAGFTVGLFAYALPTLAKAFNWLSALLGHDTSVTVGRLVQASWQVTLAVAAFAASSAIGMLVGGAEPALIQLTIGTIILTALAIAELADTSSSAHLRHVAVFTGLVAVGLWATVDPAQSTLPLLTGSMRWLVASAIMIPLFLFAAPKVFGETVGERWRPALERGAGITAFTAAISLVVMLATEAIVRTPMGIQGISRVLVIGVAIVLAALGIIVGLVAILSGPHSRWNIKLKLSDQQRRWLILASQAIGGITWLHVFLCKTHWAFIGLRGYWPFIVMGLAFISVGATEWAKRRGDQVMSETLRQTALYLPLLPVVGFWFSGTTGSLMDGLAWTWDFTGGRVPYEGLLAFGAVYYIGLSSMWKGWMPRITAVLLGNAALWVVLIQQPGWNFVSHPQAWLIPPAACVLFVSHLYRDRLKPSVASGIRYASTLVIYVSSTADMLLQQIGTSISGPIILVLLALAGMVAGVVLRVRPFLYLGATFVFIGVTSMVWHATESLGQVWPWWVFGIGTGICLLVGLMAIEKNKPKLQRLANSLATWEA